MANLLVVRDGQDIWHPVCSSGVIPAEFYTSICTFLGYEAVSSTFMDIPESDVPMESSFLDFDYTSFNLIGEMAQVYKYMSDIDACPSGNVIQLMCEPRDKAHCGRRAESALRAPRIVNGDLATQHDWPWHTSVYLNGGFLCGGTLVDTNWVVTAAYCVAPQNEKPTPEAVTVGIGSTQLDDQPIKASVKSIHVNPKFNWHNMTIENIALLELETPVTLNDDINTACLPTVHDDEFDDAMECYIAGWGKMTFGATDDYVNDLREAKVEIFDKSKCYDHMQVLRDNFEDYQDTYEGIYSEDYWNFLLDVVNDYEILDDSMLCGGHLTGYTSGCYYDGGSPLICRREHNKWIFAGVTSWGAFCQSYSVFTKTSHYIDWMQSVMYDPNERVTPPPRPVDPDIPVRPTDQQPDEVITITDELMIITDEVSTYSPYYDEMTTGLEQCFRCANGEKCIHPAWVCDYENDCGDLSDEIGCDHCADPGHYQCKGVDVCIRESLRCDNDGIKNCPDGDDELFCPCKDTEVTCKATGKCIPEKWLCDGNDDCGDGEDEEGCSECAELSCRNYKGCYTYDQACDGEINCENHSDEYNCGRLTGHTDGMANLWVVRDGKDTWYPVCSSALIPDDYYTDVCVSLGYEAVSASVTDIPETDVRTETGYYDFDYTTFTSNGDLEQIYKYMTLTDACPSGKVIQLICEPQDTAYCGRRTVSLPVAKIVNGDIAEPGAWPWMVAVDYRRGAISCGGTLIDPQWIITSAHCVKEYTNFPSALSMGIGSNLVDELIIVAAQEIFIHPEYNGTTLFNNLAAIKLERPVETTDYIIPACVPTEPEDDFADAIECYSTGWGQISSTGWDPTMKELREAKMPILSNSECSEHIEYMRNNWEDYQDPYGYIYSEYYWNYLLDYETSDMDSKSILCGGHLSGYNSGCYGDFGGPLVCRREHNKWTLVGVMNHVTVCQSFTVFTKTSHYLDWIEKLTGPIVV